VFGRGRRFLRSIERIDDQHRITRIGESRGHALEGRPQAEDIRPHEHCGVRVGRRVDEIRVGDSIRRLDRDLGADGFRRQGHMRQHGGQARAQRHGAKLPASQIATPSEFVEVVLRTHWTTPLTYPAISLWSIHVKPRIATCRPPS